MPAQVSVAHNIGTASCFVILLDMSVYSLLLYATISQEKPAGFQALIVYAPISKSYRIGTCRFCPLEYNNYTCKLCSFSYPSAQIDR